MEDEIDLREYVLVLVAWWREIVLLTVLAALLGAGAILALRAIQPPVYEAAATVAISRTRTDINFDERFRTLSEEDMQAVASNATARRSALVGLVSNGAIARAVIDRLGGLLETEEQIPANLLGAVEAELALPDGSRGDSDLIRIKATADSPEKAAAIANAWAEEYVRQVNLLYGQIPAELVASVTTELQNAQTAYETAQKALEAFVANNEIDRLNRLITEKREIIQSLQAGRQTAITTIVDEELAARRQIISAYINAQASNRLLAFEKEQEAKQAIVSELIAAETNNRLRALQVDQNARTQLFEQYTETQIDNQLLALTKDQEIRRRIFESYVAALVDNRLAAVQKDQELRSRLFTQYVNSEIVNRLEALRQEQTAKSQIFQAYAAADVDGKVAVFTEQVNGRLQALSQAYDKKRKAEQLLIDAQDLRNQVAVAGEAGASTNRLAIILLKAEVYATSTRLPSSLDINIDDTDAVVGDADAQLTDLDALVTTLQTRIALLQEEIDVQSLAIYNNEDLNFLSTERPEDDLLYAALQEKYLELFELDALATAASTADNSALSQAIIQKYNELFGLGTLVETADASWRDSELLDAALGKYQELFGVGALAALGQSASGTDITDAIQTRYQELFGVGPLLDTVGVFSTTTPLAETIRQQYPELFNVGELPALSESISDENPLALLGAQRAQELLQLQGLEDLPAYTAAAEPLLQAIDRLEKEIQALEAQQEAESARRQQLLQNRDLAWSTLITLQNKDAEFDLTVTATNSEVRLAAPAVEPVEPVRGPSLLTTTALAGIVGGMLAVFIAFFANFMGAQPLLGRRLAEVEA